MIGDLFSCAIFMSCFLIGLGFFAAIRAAAVSIVSRVLRGVLVAGLAVTFVGLGVFTLVG